ncbi:MAG TPA: AraC family transcriptional regulator [Thermoanaerobaculia bacterium]|nr:AraC family transcriptional regulator [Thermoanaerobaculia bacterium]
MAPQAENFIKFWYASHLGSRVEMSRGIGVTHVYPWHWHEEIQISALEEGGGYLAFRGREHATPEGSLLFVPPGEVHTNRHATPAGCSYRTLNVAPEFLARICGRGERVFSLHEPVVRDRELFRLFVATHERLEEMPPRLTGEVLLLRLLEEMCQRTAEMRCHEGYGREERLGVRRVREYLIQHYAEIVALEDLSRVANLSPYHLHRVFTREVGMSPHAFQTQVRIARAKLLLHKGRPLRGVAAETGFADQSHFTREFKRFVGLTPGAFRSDRLRPALLAEERLEEAVSVRA